MALSNNAKALIALTTRLGDGTRPSLSPSRWHRFSRVLSDSGLEPAAVFAQGFDPALPGVPEELAETVRQLVSDAAAATVAAADLESMGIWTLTEVDENYPAALTQRLGDLAPPVICGAGATDILEQQGVAIVGSRNVSEDGAAAASEISTAAVEAGYSVVSGGARGVDQLAMNSSFMHGGRVLGILADSLQARIRKPDILRALDSGNIALITQQSPAAGFTPASAMSRNKLIYAMSRVTVVIASDLESGGTWNGAVEALKKNNGVVAVWRGPGEGPGNARLAELGALECTSTSDLLTYLETASEEAPGQLTFLD